MGKTITIDDEAYDLLKSMKQGKRDSFSQVIHRNLYRKADTCGELLDMMENEPPPKVNPDLLKTIAAERGRRSGGRR
jgi:predicted CopG family antitoxin